MASVKYAISAYVADGTTTDYLITWDYLDEDHIAVYVDGTSNADPTASHTFVQLNSTTLRVTDNLGNPIVSGSEIEIRRETPLTNRAITFADGSALLSEDLNKNSDYLLYSMQEVLDTVEAAAQDGALAAQVATEGFRDEAEGFKNDAETAKNTTQTYLATVQSDATDADNHRIAAAASEAASAASEAAAATSETNSANSATAAAASEAASLASEQAASASEIASAGSATAAAASEVAAAASQVAAASSETNAEAAWDSFDDRYLGAKATAPTLDNDGNALLTGALYWNSTGDQMYVWNGASWDTFNSTVGIADGATSTAITIDPSGNTTFEGYVEVGPVDTTSDFQGISLINGKDSSISNTMSFLDARNDIQTSDAHMFIEHQTNGGSNIHWGTTPAGNRAIDRRVERMRLTEDGKLGLGNSGPSESLAVRTYGNSEISTQYGTGLKAKLGAYANSSQVALPTASTSFSLSAETGATDTINLRSFYNNNWYYGLRMDSFGRITKPWQPSFKAYTSGGQINNYTGNLVFNDTSYAGGHNIGGHYNPSTGYFTAPVSGRYMFSMSMLTNNAQSGNSWMAIFWRINNGSVHYHSHNHTSTWIMESGTVIFNLNAGDFVNLYMGAGSGHWGTYSHFSGCLLS